MRSPVASSEFVTELLARSGFQYSTVCRSRRGGARRSGRAWRLSGTWILRTPVGGAIQCSVVAIVLHRVPDEEPTVRDAKGPSCAQRR